VHVDGSLADVVKSYETWTPHPIARVDARFRLAGSANTTSSLLSTRRLVAHDACNATG
jgi:hypothetical protein